MKKLKEYIGYGAAIIMLCGWLATIFTYGKRVDDNSEKLDEITQMLEQQLEFNGRVKMYIELDSR